MRLASTFGVLLALLADTFTGKVVGISHGDTISVMRAGRAVKVRLHGIDCPEGGQDFGRRAKQFTSGLVFGKVVRVDVRDTDRYGRLVGRVFVGGTDVNLELVRAGFAWHYRRYSDDPALARAEREARAARRGLWRQPNATPPWELRQGGCVRCEHGIFTIEGPIVAPEAPAEPNEVGFGVVHATGLHLELMLNWLSAQPKLDRLQRCWNRPWAVPLIRLLLAAGGLASRYALDLVYVARARP